MSIADFYVAFGRSVAERRRAIGKSQDYVAKVMGLSRASIANIEAGRQRIALHQVIDFAEALDLSSAHELIPGLSYSRHEVINEEKSFDAPERLSKREKQIAEEVFSRMRI